MSELNSNEPDLTRTEVLHVDNEVNADTLEKIGRAAEVLRAGGLVAFPTETVYGLGANALDHAAIAKIFAAKGRPSTNPLIVHVADAAAISVLVTEWTEIAQLLAERFMPGPLTLVLPRRDIVPDIVTGGGATVAVRVPAHPIAQALLRAAGIPIAAPSANRSMQLSPTRAEHVLHDLNGRIDLILDGGLTMGGLESTVLDLTTSPPTLLRPGLISPAAIESVIGPIRRDSEEARTLSDRISDAPLHSPGMMERHYAPRAPLEIVTGSAGKRLHQLLAAGDRIGWLTFMEPENVDVVCIALLEDGHALAALTPVIMPQLAAGYAARLYDVLHDLDSAGVTRIVVELPPDSEDWLAVHDRLHRASHPA